MKKAILSIFVIVAFAIYSIHTRGEANSTTVATTTAQQTKSSNASNSNSQTATPSSGTQYKDGSYTGTSADAYYGFIQVKAIVNGGRLTNVVFLKYPNDRRESVEISSQAMPILKQEAIQAQNAQIDGVSGATDTTQAFIESLSAALNQAKA